MKLALCNEMFEDTPFDEVCRLAVKHGYEGIELAPFVFAKDVKDISPDDRRQIADTAARYGLEIIGLHWLLAQTEGLHVTAPDVDVRNRTTDYLKQLVRFCVDVGGRVLVFGSPMQRNLLPGVTFDQALDFAAEVFTPVADMAKQEGAMIAFEPLSHEETDFGGNIADGIRIVEKLDHPNFRLHFDARAMSYESTPLHELVRAHAPLIEHVHVNDPNKLGPGMGDLDLIPMIHELRRVGYNGYLSVEVFRIDPGAETIAQESADYLRNALSGGVPS